MDVLPEPPPRLRPCSATAYDADPLLTGAELLRALRGDRIGEHPLALWAWLLGRVHREIAWADGIGCERGDLVHMIDVWTQHRVPQHRHGAALHTETLGSVIDRIAAAQVHADGLLAASVPAGDPRVHSAWHRLAELIDGYNDLARQVVGGLRRLPAPAEPYP